MGNVDKKTTQIETRLTTKITLYFSQPPRYQVTCTFTLIYVIPNKCQLNYAVIIAICNLMSSSPHFVRRAVTKVLIKRGCIFIYSCFAPLITPSARRAWRSYKFASLRFSVLFSVSQVGLPLMGVTAVHSCLSHDF